MEQQKARGEERVGLWCACLNLISPEQSRLNTSGHNDDDTYLQFRALVASKEHARRAFPKIRRVYQDHYLKIMVRLLFVHVRCFVETLDG